MKLTYNPDNVVVVVVLTAPARLEGCLAKQQPFTLD